jgi:outer membrane lipoprotein-sorting protein
MKGTVYNNKEFSTQVMENAKEYLLQLTPTTTMMKKMFAKIEVYVDKKNYNVLRLNMVEQGGDNSLMTFTNHMLNKNLMDALFSLK